MPRSMTQALTQAEIIALSGKLNRATELCERRVTVHQWADGEAARRADMLAEMTAIRDAVTLAAPQGTVSADILFAPSVAEFADRIMMMIAADIAAGIVPDAVASFRALHSAVDANQYVDDAGVPWGAGHGYGLANAVTDEVSRRLAARPAAQAAEYGAGYRDGRADAMRHRVTDVSRRSHRYRDGHAAGYRWTLDHMPASTLRSTAGRAGS